MKRKPLEPVLRFSGVAVLAFGIALAAAGARSAWASPPGKPDAEARLTAFVVIPGGRSLALFEQANENWRVQQGEEIFDDVRLREVEIDRIIVEREGILQEISLGGAVSRGETAAATVPQGTTAVLMPWLKSRVERVKHRRKERQRRLKGLGGAGEGAFPKDEGTE